MAQSNSMLKIRLFGTDKCHMCQKMKIELSDIRVEYDFIDANAADMQEICDSHSVSQLPHIQVYNTQNNKVIYEKIGYIHPMQFINNLQKSIGKDKNKSISSSSSCSSCGRKKKEEKNNTINPDPNLDFLK